MRDNHVLFSISSRPLKKRRRYLRPDDWASEYQTASRRISKEGPFGPADQNCVPGDQGISTRRYGVASLRETMVETDSSESLA